jgi:hypothetical protein
MNAGSNNDPFPLYMSQFNRIQNPVLESVALICAKRGEVVIIHDEPETRTYKDYQPLIRDTLTSLIKSNE